MDIKVSMLIFAKIFVLKNIFRNAINSQMVFYRYFRRKGWKRFLKENILESEGSRKTKAQSVALGVFIGFSPFWGFHTFLALSLSVFFKLNKVLTFMSSQITLPPFIPFVIFASLMVGAPIVGGRTDFGNQEFNLEMVKNNLIQYVVGSLILATLASLFFGFLTYFLLGKKR
ncbi:MAG: DUF2062 domain-containing protein [Cruoricaptor ignavus]|nr:DUF2062 domain-containing protein [Cruoricaptor ignavus]